MLYTHRNPQRGIALFVSLLALLLISAIAMGMMFSSNLETVIGTNSRDARIAHYAAISGIEEVRDRLAAGEPDSLAAKLPSAPPDENNGVLYVLNVALTGASAQPWVAGSPWSDSEICKEIVCAGLSPSGSAYQNAALSPAFAHAGGPPPLAWVRVMQERNWRGVNGANDYGLVCWTGTNEIVTASSACPGNSLPVYTITALALTTLGTRELQQYEVVLQSLASPFAAVTLIEGASAYTAPGNGAYPAPNDAPSALPFVPQAIFDGAGGPAIGVADKADLSGLASWYGSTAVGGGVQWVDSALANFLSSGGPIDTVAGVEGLIADASKIPWCEFGNYTGCSQKQTDCTGITWGNDASPSIVIVSQCNFTGTGSGLLIATGQVNITGDYHGLIICAGSGDCINNADSATHIRGAVVIAQSRDRATGTTLGVLGVPRFTWKDTHANKAKPSVQYDRAAVERALSWIYPGFYRKLSVRQVNL